MRLSTLPSFIFCLIYPATAQIQHGTVGVVYFTQDKISVAADSRGIIDQNTPPDDTVCKLAAFGGDVIFVSAGSIRNSSQSPLVPSWDNLAEARSAYNRVVFQYSTSRGHVREIAEDWNISISSNFDTMARYAPDSFAGAVDPAGNLTSAMIGGLDDKGNLVLFGVTISAVTASPASRAVGLAVQADCPHRRFCAIGAPEIVTEFADEASERSKTEAKEWKPPNGSMPRDYDMLRTIRMADLTVLHHVGKDVGGPIDAAQLDRDGSIHWYARKKNCQDK